MIKTPFFEKYLKCFKQYLNKIYNFIIKLLNKSNQMNK